MGSRKKGGKRKRAYPHNEDIAEVIVEVLSSKPWISPLDFVDEVRKKLEEKGFFTGLVSAKRIWRLYREMVEKGRISDVLGVVPGYGYVNPYEAFADEKGSSEEV